MVVRIFNSMMRIDRSRPGGCDRRRRHGWQTLWNVIIRSANPAPHRLDLRRHPIVMGDFVTVRMMSGGQSASVSLMMMNANVGFLQYPRGGPPTR